MSKPINLDTLFSDRSNLYAAARPGYPPELFEYIASLCPAQICAWDCATGSGQAARSLIQYFTTVKATDVSSVQIQNAVRHQRIQYSVQRAEDTNFAPQEFDLITVAQALHWFDLPKFWKEADRVLKPSGILAVWGYSWLQITPEIDQQLNTSLYPKIRPYWAPQNQILWDGYNTVDFPWPILNSPLFSLQFSWTLDQLFSYLQTWSAVRRCIATEGQTFLTAAQREVEQCWGDPSHVKTMSMDLFLKACRKAPN